MQGNGQVDGVRYPLMDDAETLTAASGRAAAGVTLDHLAELSPEDLRISGATLRAQATVAAQSGFGQLAENLTRAAELTAVPNEELLMMYETMRPGRATLDEMIALADRLEQVFGATETAALVREAAAVYAQRKLLKNR
jgi:propanediol dehydratase small subunit